MTPSSRLLSSPKGFWSLISARSALLLAWIASAALAPRAFAADVQIYSADALGVLWKNEVASQALTSLTPHRFESSLIGVAIEPSTNRASSSSRGGTKAPSDSASAPQWVYFSVYDIDPALQAELIGRQVALASFLTKSDRYQPDRALSVDPTTGTPQDPNEAQARSKAKTNLLTLRRYSARVELFLIAMLRYQVADAIPDKCAKLREAEQLLGLIEATKEEVDALLLRGDPALALEARFELLRSILNQLTTSSSQAIRAATACIVTPASNRRANLTKAVELLEARLADYLDPNSGALKETLSAIGASKASLEAQQARVSQIQPHSSDLLQLELEASNAASNFNMVRSDSLAVQNKVAEMKTTARVEAIANLGNLNDETLRKHDKLGSLDAQLTTLKNSVTSLLSLLRELPQKIPPAAAQSSNPVARCSDIAVVDISTTTVDTNPIRDCLSALTALVDAASKKTSFQDQMADFSSKVNALSPEIIKDRSGL